MNISHKYKFIAWLPARTGSRYVGSLFYNWYNMEYSIPHNTFNQIKPIVNFEDYKIILLVRNPYTRFLSIKWYLGDNDSIEEVIQRNMLEIYGPVWSQILKTNRRPDYIIRLETLKQDLEQLPFWESRSLPKNTYQSKNNELVHHYYNDKSIKLVQEKYSIDFEQFGYSTDLGDINGGTNRI